MIELGGKYKDRVSGFQGVATARAEYLTGVTRAEVTPMAIGQNEIKEPMWFDEGRLERIGHDTVNLAN